jgi:MarR family transcriptional regulator, organic hydroperoxide resistance regulator
MTESQLDSHKLSLGQLLASISRLVGKRMRIMLEEIGLHQAQAMVLYYLWHKDDIAQNVLAKALHITPPTATNTLQRMERDGWVQRRRDTADNRVMRVHLTRKAKALRKEANDTFQELDKELTAVLCDGERDILFMSLVKVRRYLLQTTNVPDRVDCDQIGATKVEKAVR